MTDGDRRLRVKLIGNWCSPRDLCREWARMALGALRWNDLEVTWEDHDVDFYVVVNWPWPGEAYLPERTIVFQMEPWCAEPYQTWGVKTWGEWSQPDPARFLQVRSHRRYVNNAYWQLRASYDELRTRPIRKRSLLSTICSAKYFDPGHIKRTDFLRFLDARDDDVVRVDTYGGRDNPLGLRGWRELPPPDDKDPALLPYRYHLAVENNREHNYITEKLWEPLLTETLCFYWGAPNTAEQVDPRAFIPLDLDDFEAALHTIKTAILANEWERRLEVIRREKRKVLEHYQFFPTLERILRHDFRFTHPPSDAEVTYHKYFADALDEPIQAAAFIHSYTRDGDTTILTELLQTVASSGLPRRLDRLYVVNVGDEIALPPEFAHQAGRVRLVNYSPHAERGEQPTLELVRTFASFHPDANLLYLHTKGASHPRPRDNVDDWRRLLVHFLVERFPECLAALETHAVVGCNLSAAPRRHLAGNFWWARARYLQSLPPVPTQDRHDAEWWILSRPNVRVRSLHDSGVDHYLQPYPRAAYAR
jgi:glycosyl transferase family 10 (putative fucosyltransferase)